MNDTELLDALYLLLPTQLDDVILRCGAPEAHLPSPQASQAARAHALVRWVQGQPAKRPLLVGALADTQRATAASPLLRWQQACYAEYRQVRVVGYEDKAKIRLDLDDVFVPLHLMPGVARDVTAKHADKGEALAGLTRDARAEVLHVDLPGALAEVERLRGEGTRLRGLALLGEPGAGKTTLLRWLYCHALPGRGAQGSHSVGLPPGLQPVLLRCGRVEPGDLRPGGLRDVIEREAAALGHAGAGHALWDETGRGTPLVVLLDGLDEVHDEARRVKLCNWIDDEAGRAPEGWRFVATCRFAAWKREARLCNLFLRADLRRLGEQAVSDYVGKWFRAVHLGQRAPHEPLADVENAAQTQAEKLRKLLLDPQRANDLRLRPLTENPLLLSTLCLVHHVGQELPRRRGELYSKCIGLLLDTWARTKGEASPYLPDTAARQVLQPLAWEMHASLPADGSAQTVSWTGAQVEDVIREPLRRVKRDLDLTPAEFLQRARDACGVLTSRDLDRYEFFHLSFQEYLAAAHARDTQQAEVLAERAGEARWREVILLAMSMPPVVAPFLRALLARPDAARHADLLAACCDEALPLDPAPFVEVLERATSAGWWQRLTRRGPQPEVVATVLRVFQGRDEPTVRAAAEALARHRRPDVRRLAAGLLVRAGTPEAGREPEAGRLSREPATGIVFVWVPRGSFLMGSSKQKGTPGFDPDAYDDETPPRHVHITSGFWMAQHPVTNEQYARFLGANPKRDKPALWDNPRFNAAQQPVVGVSFDDARAFCAWATQAAPAMPEDIGLDLPTEAEWEYAARGSEGRRYPWGDEAPDAQRAVFGLNGDDGAPAAVGGRPAGATPLGIHDLAGNVWEWCLDEWGDHYPETEEEDPCHLTRRGVARAVPRVVRGGSWVDPARLLPAAFRDWFEPANRYWSLGFRVVCRRLRQLEP
jgi:formylglycine-generating enzyme required for sulfatase activity